MIKFHHSGIKSEYARISITGILIIILAACSDDKVDTKFRTSTVSQPAQKPSDLASSEQVNASPSKQSHSDQELVIEEGLTKDNDQPFKVCGNENSFAIRANIYKLPPLTSSLPDDFSVLESSGEVCLSDYGIAGRQWKNGFPGLDPEFIEWFGLDTYTLLKIEQTGTYTFYLNSDDGSKLYIDDKLILNNDGLHPETELSVSIELQKGMHKLNLEYFQGPREFIALELFWQTPNSEEKVLVPASAFFHDQNSP